MTEQNESEEIAPLKVSPTTVWHDNQNTHRISENEEAPRGAFTDEQAEDLGFKHPTELGESVLGVVGIEEQYPDEIELQAPSATTLKHWNEITEYKTTSDGQTWLCAIGEDGEIFAATKATSDNPANNQRILFSAASDILLEYKQKAA